MAVADLQRMDGSPDLITRVIDLMAAGGLTWNSCQEAQVDGYDLKTLFSEKFLTSIE